MASYNFLYWTVQSILRKIIYYYFFVISLWSSPNKNLPNISPLPAVPKAFVAILEIILQKLVGLNLLPKQYSGPEIFNKIRVKFSNATKKVILKIIKKKQFPKITVYHFVFLCRHLRTLPARQNMSVAMMARKPQKPRKPQHALRPRQPRIQSA